MTYSLKNLSKEYPLEAVSVLITKLEETGLVKAGEKVSFQFPEALQKAAQEGIDIYKLENLVKILNLKITGEPDQVIYSYKIITESQEYEIHVTALDYMYQSKCK